MYFMKITSSEFNGEGMQRVYENEKWTVGIKNWKPANDITGLDMLERHNQTDELFVLLAGSCTLVCGEETAQGMVFSKTEMEPGQVYNIPQSLWHNTVTRRDTKMILVEDVSTGAANSDFYNLSNDEIAAIRELVG